MEYDIKAQDGDTVLVYFTDDVSAHIPSIGETIYPADNTTCSTVPTACHSRPSSTQYTMAAKAKVKVTNDRKAS